MPLTDLDRETIEAFRQYVEDSVVSDDRYGPAQRHDRDDESTLATHFEAGPDCRFEVVVQPMVPQIRVGFLTNNRSKSEEVEQAIQDSGDSMEHFLEVGFTEAGLDWKKPTVEHYRDGEANFYFATPLEVEDVVDLDTEELRNQVLRMLEGYMIAFGPAIESEED